MIRLHGSRVGTGSRLFIVLIFLSFILKVSDLDLVDWYETCLASSSITLHPNFMQAVLSLLSVLRAIQTGRGEPLWLFLTGCMEVFNIVNKVHALSRMAQGMLGDARTWDMLLLSTGIESPIFNLFAARALPEHLQVTMGSQIQACISLKWQRSIPVL
jgi:hypothetical protein